MEAVVRMVMTVVDQEMKDCDLVLVYDTDITLPILNHLFYLPNARQVSWKARQVNYHRFRMFGYFTRLLSEGPEV